MRIILICFLLGLLGCSNLSDKKQIVGTWKIDSVYTYYNGFEQSFGESDEWPVYSYAYDGIMKEIKGNEGERSYTYEFIGNDSLVIHPTSSGNETFYEIILLNKNNMVLKKKKMPIFNGGNQNRYEIRYFTKMDDPKGIDPKFKDPRISPDN